MKAQRHRDPAAVDDGIRVASDAYDSLGVELRPVALNAYKGQHLRPIGARVHDLPLRRCPGCTSRNAAPIGIAPGRPERVVYKCNVCRREHFADAE